MSAFKKKKFFLSPKQILPAIAAALFLAPSAASAELFLTLRNTADNRPVPEITLQTVKRPMDVSLNENGDLVIRRGGVSLIMAYSPSDEFIEPQERLRIAQRQDCPAISGISLKISFLF